MMTITTCTYSVVDIIQPTKNSHNVSFNESASSIQLICSLNIDIPFSVMVTWMYNDNLVMTTPPNGVITAGNTTTLVIGNPQPSDAGVYQCLFNDTVDQWILRRNIILEMQSAYNI